jgi:prepilin-type N-terminal cleavage/methylation domain-containing protein/prepilin-type processing-associated H-X9-DG protein
MKKGFSLIELLVVIFIISVLLALLLPAVQSAREAARRAQCFNNFKQLGLGLQQYETGYGVYPASMYLTGSGTTTAWFGGWSVNARILPFLERNPLLNAINFTADQYAPVNSTVTAQSIGVFVCPSENNPQSYNDPLSGTSAVTTIGWCTGDWYVWGGFGGFPNRTAFGPNLSRSAAAFRDGLSSTMMASEVHSHQQELTYCSALASLYAPGQGLPPNWTPQTVGGPTLNGGGGCIFKEGHNSWADGSVDQSGMTTAWPPNNPFIIPGLDALSLGFLDNVDLDLVGTPERNGGPTFAAVTSRSYHPDGVNALFGDGSVHFIKQTINPSIWRALGTVNGSEIISSDAY